MGSEITIHIGSQGSHTGINIDWFDENNIRHCERIAIMVEEWDKPRTLVITFNGHLVAKIDSKAIYLSKDGLLCPTKK